MITLSLTNELDQFLAQLTGDKIASSFNGRTLASGASYGGSNPSEAASLVSGTSLSDVGAYEPETVQDNSVPVSDVRRNR